MRCYLIISEYNVISKFLNRILGIPVEQQNALFQYFTETLSAVILQAKRNGRWDLGILGMSRNNYVLNNKSVCESRLAIISLICAPTPNFGGVRERYKLHRVRSLSTYWLLCSWSLLWVFQPFYLTLRVQEIWILCVCLVRGQTGSCGNLLLITWTALAKLFSPFVLTANQIFLFPLYLCFLLFYIFIFCNSVS